MLLNIIDNRKNKYKFSKINAIIEPTWHDNACKKAEQAKSSSYHWMEYAEHKHITLTEAVAWASTHPDNVTLYLYDEDGGLYVDKN